MWARGDLDFVFVPLAVLDCHLDASGLQRCGFSPHAEIPAGLAIALARAFRASLASDLFCRKELPKLESVLYNDVLVCSALEGRCRDPLQGKVAHKCAGARLFGRFSIDQQLWSPLGRLSGCKECLGLGQV